MKFTFRFVLSLSILSFVTPVLADVRLPGILSDNMVLQQKSQVKLWGWALPDEKIKITTSWNNKTDSVTASGDAVWMLNIATPAAGGPFTITIRGNNTIELKNILIGEVWVCSGQSNMEWSYNHGLKQMESELTGKLSPNIRLFNIPKTTSSFPQDDCAATWTETHPETLKGFSAVGYFFGKRLQEELNVPIGLIHANWGGTAAEVWTPEEAIADNPVLKEAASKIGEAKWWPHLPGRAYNAMIAPITSFNIAGVIWYQGESNASTASTYDELMRTLISSWRKQWNKELPFYYVQIAPFAYGNKNIAALLREAQSKTMSYPKTGMVVVTDLVDNIKDIHPQNKSDVGKRLAAWALAENYGKKDIPHQSPVFRKMEVDKNRVMVYFDYAPNGLMLRTGDQNATEFYIAGTDRKFYPANVRIVKDQVILSAKEVRNPVAVRFGFSNTAMANIFSREGLPVAPFRTDNWEVDTGKVD